MQTLNMRLHPGLRRTGPGRPRRLARTFHMQQGPHESGGPLCIWMALAIFRAMRVSNGRPHGDELADRFGATLSAAAEADVQGTGDCDTPLIVETLPAAIRHEYKGGSMRDVIHFITDRLERGALVMV